ncbi:hypothetical protein PR202_ga14855 [Eleusine coracana subsp. coracana]|uniref:Premnaspirodiene oxygenase n=1 Tax=Eleusine coracana subsp. coracana TaxID=191504 RepID=A0AAV5CIN6_ELECO|nr:hypothetical protein PR202_ga14855 [Eleusine coracana subsp. coracana]
MCPGMAFGLANVELALASLLFHFDWEAPGLSDPAEFDMTEAFGITARRKANLLLRPILRVPLPGSSASLHHIAGKLPHHAMRDLARRHGTVMLLRFGEVEVVVVSSREAAREVTKTHDASLICVAVAERHRFGLANVEIALASLLFHFDWEAPSEFDMTEASGLTARRKSDLPILGVPIPAPEAKGNSHGGASVPRDPPPPAPRHPPPPAPHPCRVAPPRQHRPASSSIPMGAPADLPPAAPRGALGAPRAMRDLASRHGPLVLLRLGGLRVVVASSADAAREVMRTRDLDLATRPLTRMMRLAIPEGAEGVIFAPYGDGWRQIRKICTVELLSTRRVQSFRPVREEETRRLLRAMAASKATPVNLSEMLSAYAADSSVRAIIGSRFKHRDAFLVMLERGVKLFAKMSLPDLYPSSRLALLVSRMPGKMKRHRQEVSTFLGAIVREHQESRTVASHDKDEDLLDVLLRIQREGDLQFPLTTDNIKSVVGDMFAGGSETAATTLQWTMAELMKNPRVMQKAQEELLGFDIPAGTMVLVNAWAISRDPKYWDVPDEFVPERFEDNKVDFKGTDFQYTPFGAGRRMCPGMAFGLAHIELVLASLRYHFDWKLPCEMEAANLDMTEETGVTVRRLQDLLLVQVVRVPLPVD